MDPSLQLLNVAINILYASPMFYQNLLLQKLYVTIVLKQLFNFLKILLQSLVPLVVSLLTMELTSHQH